MSKENSTNLDFCSSCSSCYSCSSCFFCVFCFLCSYCSSCSSCFFCSSCAFCYSCDSCSFCFYSKGLRLSENMIFCLGEGKNEIKGAGYQKSYYAFNKKITEDRYKEILEIIKNDILKDLEIGLDEGYWSDKNWSDEWKKVTNEQWKKISRILEFDKEVVEGIIGFELDLDACCNNEEDNYCSKCGNKLK